MRSGSRLTGWRCRCWYSSVSPWHTDQDATARFRNLHAGTRLLLNVGRAATITTAWVTLGPAHGASFQLRAGAAPALADLSPVARAASRAVWYTCGSAHQAHGRYVLIWFT